MNSLHRLIYTSFKNTTCNEKEIKDILETSYRKNFEKGITGILTHSDSRFIQYLEGPLHDLEELFEAIKADSRHTAVSNWDFAAINQRIFPHWDMGYLEISNEEVEYNTSITDEDKSSFNKLMERELDTKNKGIRLLQLFYKHFSQSSDHLSLQS